MRRASSLAVASLILGLAMFCGRAAHPALAEPNGICTSVNPAPTPSAATDPSEPSCLYSGGIRYLYVSPVAGASTSAPAYSRIQDGTTTQLLSVPATIGTADSISSQSGGLYADSYLHVFGSSGWNRLRDVTAFGSSEVGLLGVGVCSASANACSTVATNNGNFGAGNAGLFTIDFDYLWDPTGSAWTRRGGDTSTGVGWGTIGGSRTATIAAATSGPTVIKNAAGRLENVVITTAGTNGTETFYDNASACSGTVLGTVQGTTAVAVNLIGTILKFDMPAANGITACGGTGSAAVTASYY